MAPTVECCLRNVTPEGRRAARRRGIDLTVAPCLEHCGHCRAGPFVVVDGDLRTGESFPALLDGVADETEATAADDSATGSDRREGGES